MINIRFNFIFLFIFLFTPIICSSGDIFKSVWTVENDETITLPIFNGGNYDFEVDWGDGSSTQIVTSYDSPNRSHTYTSEGTYTIKISGTLHGWNFYKVQDSKDNIIDITQWGNLNLVNPNNLEKTDVGYYFYKCRNLVDFSASDTLDTSEITNMQYTFYEAKSFNGNINDWDVSSVTDMKGMFSYAFIFNQPLNEWDVSRVTDMSYMFSSASSFNQPLDNWNVSNVINMEHMFTSNYLSTTNYDKTLIGWYNNGVQNNIIFNGGASQYCNSKDVRNILINEKNWTITDTGENCDNLLFPEIIHKIKNYFSFFLIVVVVVLILIRYKTNKRI